MKICSCFSREKKGKIYGHVFIVDMTGKNGFAERIRIDRESEANHDLIL
jgi:hypothetical protein